MENKNQVKNQKLKNKIRQSSQDKPIFKPKKSNNKFQNKKKSFSQHKPTKQIIDYFPRDSNDHSDFTYNIATLNKEGKKEFLSKKRKTNVKSDYLDDNNLGGLTDTQLDRPGLDENGEVSRLKFPKFEIGDLVLLSISEIHKDYMIANYTRNIKAMIHMNYTGLINDKVKLSNIFKIGQFICGAIVSPGNDIQLSTGHLNKKILVSLDPKITNLGLDIKNLKEGMDVWGRLIFSEKSLGYEVDFQINNSTKVQDLLETEFNNEEEEEENEEQPDEIDNPEEIEEEIENEEEENAEQEEEEEEDLEGYVEKTQDKKRRKQEKNESISNYQIILEEKENKDFMKNYSNKGLYFFKIIKIEVNENQVKLIHVSLNQEKYKKPIKSLDYSLLKPGFLFKSNITRELQNGVEVAFGGNLGGIFIDHLRKGKSFLTRVIHIAKNHKIALSSKKHIVGLENKEVSLKLKQVGETHENVEIKELLFGNSYEIRINDKKAFLHKINIQSNQILNKGDTLPKIRVKEYNFFDDKPILTAISSEIENNTVTWNNIAVGQILDGTIINITKEDLYIQINHFISGKLNKNHICDFPLNAIPKKYKVNTKIKVRVLVINYETKNLIFTSKETLMESNLNPDIKSLKEGEEVYVTYKGNNIFHYCGDINGKLINKMKESELKPGKLFLFRIYKINETKKNVVFTNSSTVWVPGVGDFDSHIRRNPILSLTQKILNKPVFDKLNDVKEDNSDIHEVLNNLIGSVQDFKIVKPKSLLKLLLKQSADSNVLNDNLDALTQKFLIVKMMTRELNIYGFCPLELVSDFHPEKCFASYIKNSQDIKMLVLNFQPETMSLFVTGKNSLIKLSEENKIPREKENLQTDIVYSGYVSKILDKKGIVVQFLGQFKSFIKFPKNFEHVNLGQTIFARYTNKEKFSLQIYKNYKISEVQQESKNYFSNYLENLLYLTKDKINGDLNIVEGKIFQLTQDGLLITLCNESKFIGSLRKDHMLYYEQILNEELKVEDKYKIGDKKRFEVVDIDYINGIIFLTDKFTDNTSIESTEEFFNKHSNSSCEIRIDLINEHYIAVSLKENPNIKGILLCNLYNFTFDSSQIYDIVRIGDILKVKLFDYCKALNKLVFDFPIKFAKKLVEKELKKSSSEIALGGVISGIVNGIKGTYIYLYVNKKTIGKIHISNYNGDIEQLREKFESTEMESTKEKQIVTGKIIHIEQKNDKTVLEITTNYSQDDLETITYIENVDIKFSGVDENIGIISKVDIKNKFPLQIDLGTKKRIKIYFNKIPLNYIRTLKDKYKIGDRIKFFAFKHDEENEEYSLSPIDNNKDSCLVKSLVAVRILKKITGKGLVVELDKDKSGFVDLCEITDEIHPSPLDKIPMGTVTIGRIKSINEDLSKNNYMISLRDSIVIDKLYDIIANGSSLQFLNEFKEYEKYCDYRNKILKLKAVNTIEQNLVMIGYVVNSSEKGVFIKVASDTTVRAGLRELTDEKTTKPFLLFKPEQLIICRVLSFFKNSEKIEKINVSLRESVVKYNLTMKMKDLILNSFYECLIMNENEERFQVNVVGSTFTGYIKIKNINPNTKSLFTVRNIVVLQLVKIDKNIHPPKLRFSNTLIENYNLFDQSLIVNSCNDEQEKQRRKTYVELYENVKKINENYQLNKEKSEFRELEKKIENIDFENLIEQEIKYNEEENENDEEEDEDEGNLNLNVDQENDDIEEDEDIVVYN